MRPILGGEDFGKITWFSGGEQRGEISRRQWSIKRGTVEN